MLETAEKYTVDIDSEGNASSASQETNTITGGYINRVSCAMPKTCPLNLRHSEGSRASITSSSHARLLLFLFSALLAQPPISPRTTCPTMTGRLQWTTRRSSDRKRARTSSRVEERLDCRGRRKYADLGFSTLERAPRKFGM